jgi:hypothetical protein
MSRPAAEPLPDGSLDFAVELRCAITKAIKGSGMSRAHIAERMSALLGGEVSEAMLDAWTAPSRGKWKIPFEYAAAFDEACGSSALLELLARKRNYRLLAPKDALDAELGRIGREMARLKARQSVLLTAASIEGHR